MLFTLSFVTPPLVIARLQDTASPRPAELPIELAGALAKAVEASAKAVEAPNRSSCELR